MDLSTYCTEFNTIFVGDYKELFTQEVDKLIKIHFELEDRKLAIEFLTERYISDTGKRPVCAELERLATHMLYESLEGDTRRDKMTLEEYPIITPAQVKRRKINRGETSADFSSNNFIGSDGKQHGKPVKRYRRRYENEYVDKLAHDKARQENTQYKVDTSPSSITTRKLEQ